MRHVRLVSTISIDDALEFISQIYEVKYQDDSGKPQQFSLVLTFQRRAILLNSNPWWRIVNWSTSGELPPGPAK